MSKIFCVIWDDRHSDTGVYAFRNHATALAWARKQGRKYDRHGDDYKETAYGDTLVITYSCEGDSLTVGPVTIDKYAGEVEGNEGS